MLSSFAGFLKCSIMSVVLSFFSISWTLCFKSTYKSAFWHFLWVLLISLFSFFYLLAPFILDPGGLPLLPITMFWVRGFSLICWLCRTPFSTIFIFMASRSEVYFLILSPSELSYGWSTFSEWIESCWALSYSFAVFSCLMTSPLLLSWYPHVSILWSASSSLYIALWLTR